MTKYFLRKYPALFSVFLLLPSIAHAQAGTLGGVITEIGDIISDIVPIIVALALLFFFWGLAMFILNAGNEQKRTEGRGIMLWGIIALFVMLSVWGLVALLQATFNVGSTVAPALPQVPVFGTGSGGSTGGSGGSTGGSGLNCGSLTKICSDVNTCRCI